MLKFEFGGDLSDGTVTHVSPAARYGAEPGYGFEPGAEVRPLKVQGVTSSRPFLFSVKVPEGNYRVTVTLGDPDGDSANTIKAESRRLMVENALTTAGQLTSRTFIVNVRNDRLPPPPQNAPGGDRVLLNEREKDVLHWDEKLTLEFNGARPCVAALELQRINSLPTVFLVGDSTVTDQTREPGASWGQMLPRWFRPDVAIANHAESGETLKSFITGLRLAKVLSQIRRGDYLFIQFGHNDEKESWPQTYAEARSTYQAYLRVYVAEARLRGAVPVLVTPVQRRQFNLAGKIINSHGDYPAAVREVAGELGVPLIDLSAASTVLYEALGPAKAPLAFNGVDPKRDPTHHNNYGGYQLAKCVVQAIRELKLPLARSITDDFAGFDPARPDSPDGFGLTASPNSNRRPTDEVPSSRTTSRTPADRPAYLFTYFTKNGEDGLHLAWSEDGYTWQKLNGGNSYLSPLVGRSKLMRDPCVTRGPDGTYHMVWTAGWTENDIGYASTRDFLTWTAERELPVMAHEPAVRKTWAPEITYDEARGEFLIFWASTIPGRFPETAGASEEKYNHRIYCTTTKDFSAFSPTRLFYDPGFSVIDATFLRADGQSWLVVKDETRVPPKKYLQIAPVNGGLQGPFGRLSAPFTPNGLWAEGPTAIKIGDEYLVYFDAYQTKHYGAMRSRDLQHWEDVSAQMNFPDEGTPVRMRHGTVIAVPRELVSRLQAATR